MGPRRGNQVSGEKSEGVDDKCQIKMAGIEIKDGCEKGEKLA